MRVARTAQEGKRGIHLKSRIIAVFFTCHKQTFVLVVLINLLNVSWHQARNHNSNKESRLTQHFSRFDGFKIVYKKIAVSEKGANCLYLLIKSTTERPNGNFFHSQWLQIIQIKWRQQTFIVTVQCIRSSYHQLSTS